MQGEAVVVGRSPNAARAALLIRFHTFLGWLALGAWKPAKMADSILARTKRGCILVAGCVPPQAGTQRAASRHGLLASNLRACAPARRGAAAYGSASWRLAEGLILETPLDSVITP